MGLEGAREPGGPAVSSQWWKHKVPKTRPLLLPLRSPPLPHLTAEEQQGARLLQRPCGQSRGPQEAQQGIEDCSEARSPLPGVSQQKQLWRGTGEGEFSKTGELACAVRQPQQRHSTDRHLRQVHLCKDTLWCLHNDTDPQEHVL